MKKVLFLLLFLLVLGAANVSAQVRIGGDGEPHTAAVLDLNATDAINDGTKGLALPRVSLSSAGDLLSNTTIATGTLVYNTGGALSTGVYYWDGNWNKVNGAMSGSLRITSQPAPFSFSRLRETVGDPNGPVTATVAPLSVTATGTGTLTYQWYELPTNRNAAPVVAPGVSNAATYTPDVTTWGMRSYYCEVSNGTETVVSKVADVAIGCGAKTANGGWIKFSCYNLGASTTIDPFIYSSTGDAISNDIKGWLFQWGRSADGHHQRNSTNVAGPFNDAANAQVPASNATFYGKFITNGSMATFYDWRTPQYDIAWRHWNDANPCGTTAGWRIPTEGEWSTIFDSQATHNVPAAATSNTWNWASGYEIKPDGITTTLFLPAAGSRYYSNGAIYNVGTHGYYWSSTTASSMAYYLGFTASRVSPSMQYRRANGFSVRCVAD